MSLRASIENLDNMTLQDRVAIFSRASGVLSIGIVKFLKMPLWNPIVDIVIDYLTRCKSSSEKWSCNAIAALGAATSKVRRTSDILDGSFLLM